jgi:2'-5' RNA ligase
VRPPPTRMRDRWADRPELPAGTTAVYWHVLLGADPAVQAAAADVRRALRDVAGMHLTPPEWLHLTVLLLGITDDLGSTPLAEVTADVADALRGLPPIEASVGRVRYLPEAIVLAVEPVPGLRAVHERVRTAGARAFPGLPATSTEKWNPHVTVAYSTADQPTAPIIDRLGDRVPTRRFTVDAVSLVVQSGAERSWIWEPVGRVLLR